MNKYIIAGMLSEFDASDGFIERFLSYIERGEDDREAIEILRDVIQPREEDKITQLRRELSIATTNLSAVQTLLRNNPKPASDSPSFEENLQKVYDSVSGERA